VVNVWKTKNRNPRSVPMTARVASIMLCRASTVVGPQLFPYCNKWLQQIWDKARHHLGHGEDAQFVPYALRHTCASRLIQRGVPLKVVQEWLGHRSITTTMRYAHLCPTSLLDAVKVLEVPV
jgi:integrase